MKKQFSIFLLSLLLTACGGGQCQPCSTDISSSSEDQTSEIEPSSSEFVPSKEQVAWLKDLLSKQDLSPFYNRFFSAVFAQDINILSHTKDIEDQFGQYTYFYTLRNSGAWGFFYDLTKEAYEEAEAKGQAGLFDLLSIGNGDYEVLQGGDCISYTHDMGADENKDNEIKHYDFFQQIISFFTETDYRIYNSLTFNEEANSEEKINQKFNAKISKDILFDSISPQALGKILNSTNLYGVQETTCFLDDLYYEVCRELVTYSDDELAAFMAENHINIVDGEEYTEVNFELLNEEIMTKIDEHDVPPGVLTGTLFYDKETGIYETYHYLSVSASSIVDEVTGDVHTTSSRFEATGRSYRDDHVNPTQDYPNPVVYDDGNKFITDLSNNVIPKAF